MYFRKYDNLENMYIDLSERLDLHFWGTDCIISNDRGEQYRFRKPQSDILELCNGQKRVSEIIETICKRFHASQKELELAKDKIYEFIEIVITKRFLSLYSFKQPRKSIKNDFSGVRNKYYPYSISIEITSRCNFCCPFCYKSSTKYGQDLDGKVLEQLLQLKGKVKEIRFLGGEPFLYPQFSKVIQKFSQYFFVSVVTNGSVFDKFDETTLKCIDRLQFSMYGYSPYTYKINTGMAWGFRQFNNAVKMANILSMNYKVCLTLGKNTLSQMEDYVLAAVQAGAKEINFGMPAPVGRAIEGPDNKQNYIFSKEDLRFVYFKMRELKMKYKEKINVVVWQHSALYKSKKAASFAQCDGCLDCGGGWYSIVLSEKGLVRPCELLPEAIFSYGDISALYRIAEEGYFFAPELNEMINKFNTSILQENLELSQICFALDKLNTAAGGERDEK